MASVTLTITDGTAPYNISIKRVGDGTERFISYSGTTLNFSALTSNENITYNVIVTDNVGCSLTRSFSLNCGVVCNMTNILGAPSCND